jgi:glutaredoxin
MAHITVYSKPGCHLCEEALRALTLLQAETPFTLEEINIEGDPKLFAEYGEQIPVILFNGEFLSEYTVDDDQVRTKLKNEKN